MKKNKPYIKFQDQYDFTNPISTPHKLKTTSPVFSISTKRKSIEIKKDNIIDDIKNIYSDNTLVANKDSTNTQLSNKKVEPLSKQLSYKKICRECKEAETEDNILISPCKCDNELKYIHHSCLMKNFNVVNNASCKVCKYKYLYNVNTIKYLDKKEFMLKILYTIFIIIFTVFSCFGCCSIIYFIFSNSEIIKKGRMSVIYWIVCSIFSLFIVFFVTYSVIKEKFLDGDKYKYIKKYQVLNYQPLVIEYGGAFCKKQFKL